MFGLCSAGVETCQSVDTHYVMFVCIVLYNMSSACVIKKCFFKFKQSHSRVECLFTDCEKKKIEGGCGSNLASNKCW